MSADLPALPASNTAANSESPVLHLFRKNRELVAVAKTAPDDEAEATALQLLDAVGLKAHAHKKPGELSGGQQQRVAIARALALKPRLILADEPTGNLDTHTADDIFALLRAFNRDTRCACLIVTHDPRLAARCDRVVQLVDGRIAEDRGA